MLLLVWDISKTSFLILSVIFLGVRGPHIELKVEITSFLSVSDKFGLSRKP